MRIGILTLLPSLNYGSLLQCYALKTTLEQIGHDVVVFNRWRDEFGDVVKEPYIHWDKRAWLRFVIRSAFGLGDFQKMLRHIRTQIFLSKMKILPWKLRNWEDAPNNIGLDLIVVGSDQVWHCGDWGNPAALLLEGAPNIPAIAYAASFGMKDIPKRLEKGVFWGENIPARYHAALSRFKAISCREAEGVCICKGLGIKATHVVDPSLLPDFDKQHSNNSQLLVCYLLTYSATELAGHVALLEAFAKRRRVQVKVFIREGVSRLMPSAPIPTSPSKAHQYLLWHWRNARSHVRIEFGAGPAEFLNALMSAHWVVTDSFHGLMFSIRNKCDVRVLRPTNDNRAIMFARIEEFARHFDGPLLADGMDAAIDSIERGDHVSLDYSWLNQWRTKSRDWLRLAIEGVL